MKILDDNGLKEMFIIIKKFVHDCFKKVTPYDIGAADLNHNHLSATQTKAGFMSSEDKVKLDKNVATKPQAYLVTLTSSGWDSTNKTQIVNVASVVADESKQLIIVMPAKNKITEYYDASILCINQGVGQLTFKCETIPTVDINVFVSIESTDFI